MTLILVTIPLFIISCSSAPKELTGNVNYYIAAVGNANFTMVEKDGHGVILDDGSGLDDNNDSLETYDAGNDPKSSYWKKADSKITDWAVKFMKKNS